MRILMAALPKSDLHSTFRSPDDVFVEEKNAYVVTIKNNHGEVDVDYVPVSKSEKEEIVWQNKASDPVTIAFFTADFTPFAQAVFTVDSGKSKPSGPATKGVEYKTYEYAVIGSEGATDPTVIIDR
jgi:hypothetical protein